MEKEKYATINDLKLFRKCIKRNIQSIKFVQLSEKDFDNLKDSMVKIGDNTLLLTMDNNDIIIYSIFDMIHVISTSSLTMNDLFSSCHDLKDISGLAHLDVSSVVSLNQTFAWCENLSDLSPITNWNVENIIDFHGIFHNCLSLPKDLNVLNKWAEKNKKFNIDPVWS